MNQDLQNLEIKVENEGTTPQGRLTATEWNILVAAVKSLDLKGGSVDITSILQAVADAGYATQEWVNNQDYATTTDFNKFVKDFVTLDTTQAISGIKDFTNGLKVGGLSVYKSQADTIYLNANLVVRGGITAFGTNETITASIFEALPIDGATLKRTENGVLYVDITVVGGGGGTGGGISIADVENYLTTNGYATQSWVTGKGYITGINASMVTNALGYTPYNSSNPAGYITSSGSITGNAATSNRLIEEVVTDLNNATPGRIFTMTSGYGSTDGNKPTTGWVTGLTLQSALNGVYRRQLAYSDDFFVRDENNGSWGDWRKILTSTNFYDYALPKDGTASAARKLANVRYLWGQLFDGTSNIGGQMSFNAGSFILAHNATDAWTDGNGLTHPWYGIDFRAGGSYKGYISHWSGISLVSGNDITLATDKNVIVSNGKFRINQSAFSNGLTLNRTSANEGAGIVFQSNGNLLGQIGINGTKTFEVSDGTTIKASIEITTGNLLVTGGITAMNSSDKRLKKNIRKFNASKVLMSLGGVYEYEYVDSEVQKNRIYEGTHYGLIYQHVKGTSLDVMCHEREDGFGTLNYIHPKFISLIAGATMENISEVEKLKRKIRTLEAKVKQLEQRA